MLLSVVLVVAVRCHRCCYIFQNSLRTSAHRMKPCQNVCEPVSSALPFFSKQIRAVKASARLQPLENQIYTRRKRGKIRSVIRNASPTFLCPPLPSPRSSRYLHPLSPPCSRIEKSYWRVINICTSPPFIKPFFP